MNSAASHPATVVTQSDRFSLTVFLALAFHAVVILGLTFDLVDPALTALNSMEITLVHNKSDEAPEDADYLAQANQQGGGDTQEKVRATNPFSNPVSSDEQGFAPYIRQDISSPIQPPKPQDEFMTVDKARGKINSKELKKPLPVEKKQHTAAALLEQSKKNIEKMFSEIDKRKQTFQLSPSHTFVRGAKTKEYRFASYLEAWRAKVERVGNINYPAEAIQRKLSGKLILEVAINTDGSLHKVKILSSSGHKVLDEAAKRIVRLSAPFSPLTKEILEDTEILHIVRTWYFKSGRGLTTSIK